MFLAASNVHSSTRSTRPVARKTHQQLVLDECRRHFLLVHNRLNAHTPPGRRGSVRVVVQVVVIIVVVLGRDLAGRLGRQPASRRPSGDAYRSSVLENVR